MSKKLTREDHRLWDRIKASVSSGLGGAFLPIRPPFNPTLDLHGMQIHPAYFQVNDHIKEARRLGLKKVTIITGKSGPINSEFVKWLEDRPEVRQITAKNGGGAYDVWLVKSS